MPLWHLFYQVSQRSSRSCLLSTWLMQLISAREFALQRKWCQVIGIRKTRTWRSSHYNGVNTLWHWTILGSNRDISVWNIRQEKNNVLCCREKKKSTVTKHSILIGQLKTRKGLGHHFPHVPQNRSHLTIPVQVLINIYQLIGCISIIQAAQHSNFYCWTNHKLLINESEL